MQMTYYALPFSMRFRWPSLSRCTNASFWLFFPSICYSTSSKSRSSQYCICSSVHSATWSLHHQLEKLSEISICIKLSPTSFSCLYFVRSFPIADASPFCAATLIIISYTASNVLVFNTHSWNWRNEWSALRFSDESTISPLTSLRIASLQWHQS